MIDAAYAGTASKIDKKLFQGIEKADSLLINPHKWFFVPFEVACVMVKKKKNLKNTFNLIPEYLTGGIEKNEIMLISDLYASSKRTVFTWGMGLTHHVNGTDYIESIINFFDVI